METQGIFALCVPTNFFPQWGTQEKASDWFSQAWHINSWLGQLHHFDVQKMWRLDRHSLHDKGHHIPQKKHFAAALHWALLDFPMRWIQNSSNGLSLPVKCKFTHNQTLAVQQNVHRRKSFSVKGTKGEPQRDPHMAPQWWGGVRDGT